MCTSADLSLPLDIYQLFDDREDLTDQYADLNEISSNIDELALTMAHNQKESFPTLKFSKEEFYRHVDSFKCHLQQDVQKVRDPQIAKKTENERKLFIHIPAYDLIQQERIGEGGFADVYHGKWLSRHHDVAIKVIRVQNISDTMKQDFLKEIMTMYQTRYEHVISVLGACMEPHYYALVMEYMPLGSLYDLLKKREQELLWPTRTSLALQITKSINYLHKMSILHRDIKSSNFLVETTPNGYLVKVADFSLAQIRSESSRQSISNTGQRIPLGTLRWTAPELFSGGKSSMATDVYSLGMVFFEIATRSIPYENVNDIIIMNTVSVGNRPSIPVDVPSTFAAIIVDSWHQEPRKRPTCQELIQRIQTNDSVNYLVNSATPYPTTNLGVSFSMPKPQFNNHTLCELKTSQTPYGWNPDFAVRDPVQQAQLAKLIAPNSSGNIQFNVVAEPYDNKQTLDCIDVGYATVNVKQLLDTDSDRINQNIDDNTSKTVSNHFVAPSQVQSSPCLTNNTEHHELRDTGNDIMIEYARLISNDGNQARPSPRYASAASCVYADDNSNRAYRLRLAAIRARIEAASNPRRQRAGAKTKNARPCIPGHRK
ncbi:unnamed protein product [Adineta steineri]|uniref:protein kinase C n=1 Tax=Adineta steineri TaxID=433720 RepID=A0A815BPK1_9BILA|nr:unnamed protein product [Adineta steineri]CAF3776116.1 unnamed protein product [Adineta steineri]